MTTVSKKGSPLWASFESKVRAFTYTDWYLILVCAITFAAWYLKCAPLGFIGLVVFSCFFLIFSDDFLPFLVNIFAAVLMIYSSKLEEFLYLWPSFIPLGICIVIFIVRNIKNAKFKFGKMFFPQLAVSVALLIGGYGVLSKEGFNRALPTVLFLGIGVLAVYVIFNLFMKRDENRDVALYYSKAMMYIGIVVCVELLICIIRSDVPPAEWDKTYWDVGWGNRNNIATYLLFTAPMCFYLATRSKQSWLYLCIGAVQYLCLIMTFSRGGILFGAIAAVFGVIFMIIKAPSKKRILITLGIMAVAVVAIYFVFMDKFNAMIGSLLDRGFGLSGRDALYKEAWQLFKDNMILGVGMGYMGTGPCPITTMNMYLFHCTAMQIVACMGLVGVACYGFYYIMRCVVLFKDIKSKFNLFMLVVWIGFEGYSMMDTGTIVPFPNMILIIVGTLLLERMSGNRCFEGYVDSYNSTLEYTKNLFRKKKPIAEEPKAVQPAAVEQLKIEDIPNIFNGKKSNYRSLDN